MPRPFRSQVRAWGWSGTSRSHALSRLAGLLLGLASSALMASPVPVATFRSEIGESLDAFALRIAPGAIRLSMKLPAEICGEFHREPGRHIVVFYTVRRLKECSYLRKSGNAYTGITYHTHIQVGETDPRKRKAARTNARFSASDYEHRGYLASGRVVLYQSGHGTERRVR